KQHEEIQYRNSIWGFLKLYVNHNLIYDIIKIDDPKLYEKFISAINEILYWTKVFKVEDEAKFVKKYKRILAKMEASTNPNKYIINLSTKYLKYKFKPHLYKEKKKLLISITKLEYYYQTVSHKKKKHDKQNTKK
ncbi:14171_t:CDS:1, partial [Cetraspora pellucida]